MSHWLLLVTLIGFGPIPTGGFNPITGWDHYQIYRSHSACERAAKPWHEVFDSDPLYRIRCVHYGQREFKI